MACTCRQLPTDRLVVLSSVLDALADRPQDLAACNYYNEIVLHLVATFSTRHMPEH